MEFIEYLKKFNAQEKIDKCARLYKNKKVVIYGAGQFSTVIFENYDLSKLNIIAVADKKFEKEGEHEFFGLNCIRPDDIKTMDFDVILISNFEYRQFIQILDRQILYGTKNASKTIRPLIKLDFKDIFLNN